MEITLQIAEPIGHSTRELRRFTFSRDKACSTSWGHNASTVIETVPDSKAASGDVWPHDDSRWPKVCEACGYEFTVEDQWQKNENRIYRLPDGTEFVFSRSLGMVAPPGTMVRADWYDKWAFAKREFGPEELQESWLIALPDGGEWITTQKASDGAYWTVTGTAPNITVTPSIWHNQPKGWHGWIRNGELVRAS